MYIIIKVKQRGRNLS